MKTNTRLLFALIAIVAFLFPSCEPVDPTGETNDREKFIGSWTCTESNRKIPAYMVEIAEDPMQTSNVTLTNFGQLGLNAIPSGEISGEYVTVPSQYCLDDNSWLVEGDGVLVTNNSIDWNYELNDGSTLYQITAVYSRN